MKVLSLCLPSWPFNSLQITLRMFAHFYTVTIRLLIPLCVQLFST